MKRLLSIRTLALMMALSAAVAAHSYTLTNETLHYDIVYHWGLIWKHAGSATLSIKNPDITTMHRYLPALFRGPTRCFACATL